MSSDCRLTFPRRRRILTAFPASQGEPHETDERSHIQGQARHPGRPAASRPATRRPISSASRGWTSSSWPTRRPRPACSASCRRWTPACAALQTKKFDEALAAHKDKLAAYTVSLDLPFAQGRFCTAENITNMETLSDVHNHSFGKNYGVLIEGACRCRC